MEDNLLLGGKVGSLGDVEAQVEALVVPVWERDDDLHGFLNYLLKGYIVLLQGAWRQEDTLVAEEVAAPFR